MLILHCKITEIERGSEMTLTINELKDMVSMAMIAHLRESEGTCAIEVERLCDIVKWVDHYDFESALEVIRDEF